MTITTSETTMSLESSVNSISRATDTPETFEEVASQAMDLSAHEINFKTKKGLQDRADNLINGAFIRRTTLTD